MKTIPPLKTIATGIAIAGLATANIAGAKEVSFASGTPLNSMGAKAVYVFADAVEEHSEGDVTVKAYIQSLLSFMETPAGLRDGMADLGTVLTPYFPSDFPNCIFRPIVTTHSV